MRPGDVCPAATVFGSRTRYRVLVGEAYMPPGRGASHAGFPGKRPYTPVCRAGDFARRGRLPYGNGFGKEAKPGLALQDLVSPLAIPPSFLTGQKGSEKPAANSEARGTAKGACGPLWKPRGFNGVARDGFRSSQGKGSLLQYRFFPAGKAHPGSRSETPPAFAGGQTGRMHLVPIWQTSSSRAVRRGRMYAARACSPYGNVFGFVYAVALFVGAADMPPGRGVPSRGVCGKSGRFPRFVGRADFARRTDDYFQKP